MYLVALNHFTLKWILTWSIPGLVAPLTSSRAGIAPLFVVSCSCLIAGGRSSWSFPYYGHLGSLLRLALAFLSNDFEYPSLGTQLRPWTHKTYPRLLTITRPKTRITEFALIAHQQKWFVHSWPITRDWVQILILRFFSLLGKASPSLRN